MRREDLNLRRPSCGARLIARLCVALAALLLSFPYLLMQVVVNHTANILLFALYGLAMLPRLQPLVQRHARRPPARSVLPAAV